MKQKFTSLDVSAIVRELQPKIIGLRLQNVYDVSTKVFLLKFSKPDVKELVLIESGIRIHATSFSREKEGLPGPFCMKLRKHLRTRRLSSVNQLGIDRIVEFQFGFGEALYYLFVEFYAAGNVILADASRTILALLREVKPEEGTKYAVGEIYDTSSVQHYHKLTLDRLRSAVNECASKESLKKSVSFKLDLSPQILEHCLLYSGLPSDTKISWLMEDGSIDAVKLDRLFEALLEGDRLLMAVKESESTVGFILLKEADVGKPKLNDLAPTATVDSILPPPNAATYHDFFPFLFKQFHSSTTTSFPSFNLAVDEYFSSFEAQKLALKSQQQESAAAGKLEYMKLEQNARIQGLVDQQLLNTEKAQLIEMNLDMVDAAIKIIQTSIASAMDWQEIEELVEHEKKKGNVLALLIHSLNLETNQIVLELTQLYEFEELCSDSDSSASSSSNSSRQKTSKLPAGRKQLVQLHLDRSAYANARFYYKTKKASAAKQEKTLNVAAKALKSAEIKIHKELRQQQQQMSKSQTINKMRKFYWFEKFMWFLSSENYLILGGRDAQQNEMLVRKHLKRGDAYVHADIIGSSSIIIKNTNADQPIPPSTLSQAGQMAICHSRAWDAKIITSAWWVHPSQVSKTAPSGEYLTTGSFMIRGKKNFLPPSTLVYGLGLLFKVSPDSVARHFHERRPADRHQEDDVKADSPIGSQVDEGSSTRGNNDVHNLYAKYGLTMEFDENAASGVDGICEIEEENSVLAALLRESSQPRASIDEKRKSQLLSAKGRRDLKLSAAKMSKGDLSVCEDQVSETNIHAAIASIDQDPESMLVKKRVPSSVDGTKPSTINSTPSTTTTSNTTTALNTKSTVNPAQKTRIRGKSGKLKKIKEKYGDQDEEERELRMALLQSAGPPNAPKTCSATSTTNRNLKPSKTLPTLKSSSPTPRQNLVSSPSVDDAVNTQAKSREGSDVVLSDNSHPTSTLMLNSPANDSTSPFNENGSQALAVNMLSLNSDGKNGDESAGTLQLPPINENTRPLEGVADDVEKDAREDGEENESDDENDVTGIEFDYLDSLTGMPHPDDTLIHALPVCAPYSTLTGWKYRVKLIPGSTKKGKASKEILHNFMSLSKSLLNSRDDSLHDADNSTLERALKHEADLIKAVAEQEFITVLLGKVKIVMPGSERSKSSKSNQKKRR